MLVLDWEILKNPQTALSWSRPELKKARTSKAKCSWSFDDLRSQMPWWLRWTDFVTRGYQKTFPYLRVTKTTWGRPYISPKSQKKELHRADLARTWGGEPIRLFWAASQSYSSLSIALVLEGGYYIKKSRIWKRGCEHSDSLALLCFHASPDL